MSLLEIQKLPTAENSAIHLHPSDNVAIARVPLTAGQTLRVDGNEFQTTTPVPAELPSSTRRRGRPKRRASLAGFAFFGLFAWPPGVRALDSCATG